MLKITTQFLSRNAFSLSIFISGLVMCFYGDDLSQLLGDHLPAAMKVQSYGTFYPAFDSTFGFGAQLVKLGIILVGSISFSLLFSYLSHYNIIPNKIQLNIPLNGIIAGLLVSLFAFFLCIYLDYPPIGTVSNFRIHWVDNTDSFFYFFDRSLKYFYNVPYFFAGIVAAFNTLLVFLIIRRVASHDYMAFFAAFTFSISSLMLTFAPSGEDVQRTVFFMLLSAYFFTRKSYLLTAIFVFLSTLMRPQTLILIGAFLAAEFFHMFWYVKSHQLKLNIQSLFTIAKPTLIFLLILIVLFGFWYYITVSHDDVMSLFNIGKNKSFLQRRNPISVQGFTIYAFSGTYVMHVIWIFPLTYFVLTGLLISYWERLNLLKKMVIIFSLSAFFLNLVFMEYHPLIYFNFRYLVYYYPFILIVAFIVTDSILLYSYRVNISAAILFIVVTSALIPYTNILQINKKMREHVFHPLFENRRNLQLIAQESKGIHTEYCARSQRNYLSYIFRKNIRHIVCLNKDQNLQNHDIIIRRTQCRDERQIIYSDSNLCVIKYNQLLISNR